MLLETEGVPITVNPESTLYTNSEAAANLGTVDVPVGLDEVSWLMTQHKIHVQQQLHDQSLLQLDSEIMPISAQNQPQNFAVVDRNVDRSEFVQLGAQVMPMAPENHPGNLAVVERDVSFNPSDM
jgi:hypothetical protein|tara:strand:- start:58 stop:432 length:375 start_codon:yes stop_codon:yes gene_type:complete